MSEKKSNPQAGNGGNQTQSAEAQAAEAERLRLEREAAEKNAAEEKAAKEKEEAEKAAKGKLVKMVRNPPHDGQGPASADVHPDEVANWALSGWKVG